MPGSTRSMAIPTGRCPRPCTTRCSARWRSCGSSLPKLSPPGAGIVSARDAALATEAAVFRGADAIAAGLADELADPITSFRAFVEGPHATNLTSRKGSKMTTNSTDTADTDQTADATQPATAAAPDALAPEDNCTGRQHHDRRHHPRGGS